VPASRDRQAFGAAAAAVDFLVNFFEDNFGDGSPPIPRQLRHGRHPLYAGIIGIRTGLIVSEFSEGPKFCSDPHPCKDPPLQKPEIRQPQQPELRNAPPPPKPATGLGAFFRCGGTFTAFNLELPLGCAITAGGCSPAALPACGAAAVFCTAYAGGLGLCYGAAFPSSPFGAPSKQLLPNQ
jgi:hypothetical protein